MDPVVTWGYDSSLAAMCVRLIWLRPVLAIDIKHEWNATDWSALSVVKLPVKVNSWRSDCDWSILQAGGWHSCNSDLDIDGPDLPSGFTIMTSCIRCTKRSVTERFLSPLRRSGTHCQRRSCLCRLSTVLGALWRLSCLSGRSAVRVTGHNHSEKTVTLQRPWSSSGLASLWNSWMTMMMMICIHRWVLAVCNFTFSTNSLKHCWCCKPTSRCIRLHDAVNCWISSSFIISSAQCYSS